MRESNPITVFQSVSSVTSLTVYGVRCNAKAAACISVRSRYDSGMRKQWVILECLVITMAVGGCRSLREVRFAVDPSPLDYIQLVHHQPLADGNTQTTVVELQGSGYLSLRRGVGERVRSGFWTDDPYAESVHRDHRILGQDMTRHFLQQVVDAGAFDHGRAKSPLRVESPLFVQVNIGGRKNLFVTDEPAFRSLFESLSQQLRR